MEETGQPIPEAAPITPEMIAEAFQAEIGYLQRRVYDLERRLGRYDAAFERMFQEELDHRVRGSVQESTGGKEASASIMEQLRHRARNAGAGLRR